MHTKAIRRTVLALFLGSVTLTAGAQPAPVPPARHPAGSPSAGERDLWVPIRCWCILLVPSTNQ